MRSDSVLCIRSYKFGLRLSGHEPKRTERNIVINLLERISTGGRDDKHFCRTTTASRRVRSRPERSLEVSRDETGCLKGVEMPADCCRCEMKVSCEGGRTGWSALEQAPGDPGCGSTDFHNAIVTKMGSIGKSTYTPRMSRLHLSGFDVRRAGVHTVHNLDLRVAPGEIVALLGANGAGKTSTMLGLLGLLPSSGERILLGQRNITAETRARIGFVPQEGGIPTGATAEEWVRLQARVKGAPNAEELLEALHVPRDRRLARRLSGGERRRVALAAALIGTPELLILDEPTAGLDPELRATAIQHVRHAAGRGAGVLLSTHLLDEVIECADQVVVMQRGHIVRRGSPTTLLGSTGWSPLEQAERLRDLLGDAP